MGNTQENWVTLKWLKATTSNTFTSWRWKKGVVGGRLVMGGFPAHTVQFSCSVMSDSSQPHGLLHTRPLCPSPSPGVCSNSGPLSWWCHPIISSSVVPFSFCLQSFPASGSFPMSQFFTSGGQSIEVSASALVLPKNIQDWFPLELRVHPKGNQSWAFIGRTDVEAETPIFWPPDAKIWLIWKDPDAGKDWRWEEKGTTEDEMVGWHHGLNGHEFE